MSAQLASAGLEGARGQLAQTGVPAARPTSAQLDRAHRRLLDSGVSEVCGISWTALAHIARGGDGEADTEVQLARAVLVLAGELAARVDPIHSEAPVGCSPSNAAATHVPGRSSELESAERAYREAQADLRALEADRRQGHADFRQLGAARKRLDEAAVALREARAAAAGGAA